jgi:hypothetical protein
MDSHQNNTGKERKGENSSEIDKRLTGEDDILDIVSTPGYKPKDRKKYKDYTTTSLQELRYWLIKKFCSKQSMLILGETEISKIDAVTALAKEIAIASSKGRIIAEDDYDGVTAEFVSNSACEPREFIDWSKIDDAKQIEIINNPGNYFVLKKFIGNEMEKSDIRGNPVSSGEGYFTYELNLDLRICVARNIEGIIFIDNFEAGTEEVKIGLLKLVSKRCIGDDKLSEGFHIIIASDFPDNGVDNSISRFPSDKIESSVLTKD